MGAVIVVYGFALLNGLVHHMKRNAGKPAGKFFHEFFAERKASLSANEVLPLKESAPAVNDKEPVGEETLSFAVSP